MKHFVSLRDYIDALRELGEIQEIDPANLEEIVWAFAARYPGKCTPRLASRWLSR